MDQRTKLYTRLELIWWIVTVIILIGVLYPIYTEITNYPFLIMNATFIVLFITFARYIFLLQHTFLANIEWLKIAIVLVTIPIIFTIVGNINEFQGYLDEIGLEHFLLGKSLKEQQNLISYIRSETIFFGVGAVITAAIFPFRLIYSLWINRKRNS